MLIQFNASGGTRRDFEVVPRRVRRYGREILVPVEEYDVEPFVEQVDQAGGQSQKQLKDRDSQVFPNFMLGFGRDRIASDSARNPDEYRRYFDATAETRFEKIYLPILEEDSTEASDDEVLRAFANFKGDLWSVWESDAGGASDKTIVSRKYTGSTTTWEGGGQIQVNSTAEKIGFDLIGHKTRLVALIGTGTSHLTRHSTDGASWSSPTTAITGGLFVNTLTANEDINGGLLVSIGNELVAVLWDEDSSTITFFSSTNANTDWTDETLDIPSSDGPHGAVVYPGIDGEDKIYVLTMEGLWEVDTTPGTWTAQMIRPTPGGIKVYGRRMTLGDDGAVWYSVAVNDDTPAPFYRMVVAGDTRRITSEGLNLGDGVKDEMLGSVRYMMSDGGFIFASLGGGKASRNGRVVCWNGLGWHSVRRHGTANQKIEAIFVSGRDDDTVRLHYGIRTGTAVSNSVFLGQPLVNPASGVSIKRETSGFIELPYIDGGMPLISAAWLQFGINASSLSATNSGEFIQMTYGLNGASRTALPATAFEFVSGTLTQDLPTGDNAGAGETARNIGTRVTLNRDGGTNTDTPELEDVIITYLKIPPKRKGYIFTVDVEQSRGKNKLVRSDLEAMDDLGTLPILVYGPSGNRFVKVREIRWFPDLAEGSASGPVAPDALAQLGGYVDVRVEEVV